PVAPAGVSIELTSPESYAVDNYLLNQQVSLTARITDAQGLVWKDTDSQIPKVTFYADNYGVIGQSTGDGSALLWTPAAQGAYVIKAVATLKNGAVLTSQMGSINVVIPATGVPTVSSLINLRNNEYSTVPWTYNIFVIAGAPYGSLSKVALFANGQQVALPVSTSSAGAGLTQYRFDWLPSAAGSYKVKAIAYDANNVAAASKEVEIFYGVPANATPAAPSPSQSALYLSSPTLNPIYYYDVSEILPGGA
ncbi:hypothetical protein, partial [Cellvibrio zantedeschiae]|uniref:hypothetical protein n=1 Tax=Cellvibrio zantedeschiae TaxID=1237077 RepID=UPI001679467D